MYRTLLCAKKGLTIGTDGYKQISVLSCTIQTNTQALQPQTLFPEYRKPFVFTEAEWGCVLVHLSL